MSDSATADQRAEVTKRIAREGLVNVLATGIGSLLQFLLLVLVTRNFDTDTSGALFTATSIFLIIVAACVLGTDQGFVWHLATLRAWQRRLDIGPALRSGLVPILATGAVITSAGIVGVEVIAEWLHVDSPGGRIFVLALVIALLPACLETSMLAATRGLGYVRPTILVDRLSLPLIQVAATAVVVLTGGGLAALGAAWGSGYVVTGVLATWRARKAVRDFAAVESVRAEPPLPRRTRSVVRWEFWRNTIPRMWIRLCQIGVQRLDIAVIGLVVSLRDAAIYTGASRLTVLGQIATQAVVQMAQPHFAKLLSMKEYGLTRDIYRTATRWFVLATWPLYLTGIVLADKVLRLFGDEYRAGATVLVLLSSAMLIASFVGPIDTILTMSGRSGLSLLNFAAALVVDIALLALLLPRYGIIGAGIAWATAIAVRNLLTLLQVWRLYGVDPFSWLLVKLAGACIVCFAAMPGMARLLAPDSLTVLLLALLLATACYVALLARWRDGLELTAFLAIRDRRRRFAGDLPDASTTGKDRTR